MSLAEVAVSIVLSSVDLSSRGGLVLSLFKIPKLSRHQPSGSPHKFLQAVETGTSRATGLSYPRPADLPTPLPPPSTPPNLPSSPLNWPQISILSLVTVLVAAYHSGLSLVFGPVKDPKDSLEIYKRRHHPLGTRQQP